MTRLKESHWPAEEPTAWHDETIGALLARRAVETPDMPAVRWVNDDLAIETWTYAELHARAAGAATAIAATARPGDAVAICAPGSLAWITFAYASAIAGTVLVPMNPAMGDAEFLHIMATSRPKLLLGVDSFRGAELLGRLDDLASILDARPAVADLHEWLADSSGAEPATPTDDPSTLFLVQYTSGTTGAPKGAMLTHRSCVNAASAWMSSWDHRPDDTFATPVPLHHIGGTIVLLGTLATGSTAAMTGAYTAERLIALIQRTGATVFGAVPTMLFDLVRQPDFDPSDTSLRIIAGGGATVPESMVIEIEETFDVDFIVTYGQSESPVMTSTRREDSSAIKAGTLGRPLPGREVKVIDLASGATAPIGQVGEICARSEMQMLGYLAMPDATTRTVSDGWLHTGDLASMDADGNLRFQGRARDVIIRGGENIYPDQVEAAYADRSDLAGIAVVGAADERYGEVPVGVVVISPGSELDGDALERHGRERLASFQVPRRWVAVRFFPTTSSGKVKKNELQASIAETS